MTNGPLDTKDQAPPREDSFFDKDGEKRPAGDYEDNYGAGDVEGNYVEREDGKVDRRSPEAISEQSREQGLRPR